MHVIDYILGIATGLIIGFAAGAGVVSHMNSKKQENIVYTLEKEKTDISAELEDEKLKTEQLEQKIDDITAELAKKASPPEDEPYREPFVISEADFQFSYPYSEDMDFTYYQLDGILVMDTGELVEDIFGLVGSEGQWALERAEDDVVYIHSDPMEANFSIRIDHSNHYDWPDEFDESEEDY